MISYKDLGNMGEFGNQLFQIAATYAHAKRMNVPAIFPKWKYQTVFDNNLSFGVQDIPVAETYSENHFYFSPIPLKPNLNLAGYFQTEKYFEDCKNDIRGLFKLSSAHNSYINDKYGPVLSNTDVVGVHLRTYSRGNIDPRHIHPDVLDNAEYLKSAFKYFGKNKTYIICSDNISRAKAVLGERDNFYYIEGEENYIDFWLLKLCSHNICSASTFSWWASWLNVNPDKVVIAPKLHFLKTAEEDSWYDVRDYHAKGTILL
jgi:hypothetical protein